MVLIGMCIIAHPQKYDNGICKKTLQSAITIFPMEKHADCSPRIDYNKSSTRCIVKILPPALSPEEEQYYLTRYKRYPAETRTILIERNLRLVTHIVKKYQNSGEDTEDLISIGTIGLIKAIDTFDCQKAKRLGTYAAKCIENELLMHFRAKKKLQREVSIQEPIGTDKEGNEIHLLDIMESSQPSAFEQYTLKEDIKKLLKLMPQELTQREYKILALRYGLDNQKELTQRETAKQLGISRSYVSRIEKTALEKLRFRFFST